MGGGTGHYGHIVGFSEFNDPDCMTAVTTITDIGGSTGRLIKDFQGKLLPMGDPRRCLLAFAPAEIREEMIDWFNYRFPSHLKRWQEHNLLNLNLAAFEEMANNDFEEGISKFQRILRIPGHILPVSHDRNIKLAALLTNKRRVIGEDKIDTRFKKKSYQPKIKIDDLYLTSPATANPSVLAAIEQADVLIFPPGDLYTSTLPHLLVKGIPEAIQKSKAFKIYIGNLMT